MRGENTQTKPFNEEMQEALDAVNSVHSESRVLKSSVEDLGRLLAQAKGNIMDLDRLTTSQNKSMQQLNTDAADTHTLLAVSQQQLAQAEGLCAMVESEHSTCASGRNSLERIITELQSKVLVYESRLEALGNETNGNADKLTQLRIHLLDLQQQLENAEAREALFKSDFEKHNADMKAAYQALQVQFEKALQEASDHATAGRGLLDAISGHIAQRKGVGMMLRTVTEGGNLSARRTKSQDFFVKQLVAGSSATNAASIQLGDVLVAVDGTRVHGFTIVAVQDLILGPEGTTVTIAALRSSPTGCIRYCVTLLRGDQGASKKAFSDEAKEGMGALNAVYHDANTAKAMCKTLEDKVADLNAALAELHAAVASHDCVALHLHAEMDMLKATVGASEREPRATQDSLDETMNKHSSCEKGRTQLNSTVNKLKGANQAMHDRMLAAMELQTAFDDLAKRENDLTSQMAQVQLELEGANQKASDKETAGLQLLEAVSGHVHVVERKGVGMVVRIETTKPNGEYQVKQLIAGGSA